MRRIVVCVLTVVSIVLMAAVVAIDAHAAAPRYILVSGPGLQRPVVLGNWRENLAFLIGSLPGKRPEPDWRTDRPRYDLALFWDLAAKPVPTDPRKTSQHGWFYPAFGSRGAVLKLMISGQDRPRVATREALRILARHDIPTRIK
jgi:hypothetical protein